MKKYIFSIIAMVLCLMSVNAQTVSIADVTLNSGETKVISINLNNTQTNIVSFQMDLSLPDGITINKAGCELSSRITDENQELVIGKQPDGSIRLTSTSFALTPIAGTSGEIIKLSLSAANDAKGGTASLSNIKLATSDSQKLTLEDASSKIGVTYKLTYKVDDEIFKTDSVVYNSALTPLAAPTKEGHTFSGWSEIPATMPANNVIITGTFTINNYTLTYKVDSEVYKTASVTYGTALTPENAPTKEGYSFSGWSEIPSTMPANDVVITGSFSVNSYTLTYKVDGEVYKTTSVAYGTAITPENAPTKEGYTFSGWSEIPATMPANDVVITGTLSINQYTMTFVLDNGEENLVKKQDYASVLTAPENLVKTGFTFKGWSPAVPATVPASDMTFTAQWERNKYLVTFIVEDTIVKKDSVLYEGIITKPADPVKEGYTFTGWQPEIPETMPANDLVITGTFTVNNYSLTYKIDGEVYKTSSVAYGTALTPETAPTKEGYTFSGWSEIPETMPANDVVITGAFSINQYTMTFVLDNGEENLVKKQDYASALTAPENLVKTGFTFKGWSPAVPATVPASDMTFTAQWERNKYLVTFIVEDTVVKKDSVLYEGIITKPIDPAKEGYTFSGWSEIPETMPANDVVITGTFTVNTYTVTFMYNDKVLKVDSVEYGAKIPLPTSLDDERYVLVEWLDVPETMPAHDITIYASITNGIRNVSDETEYKIYDERGQQIPRMKRGLNIIKYNNGTTRKVIVK